MNPYQIIGIIFICTLIFAALVAGLTVLGVPLLLAFLGVYIMTIWFMIGMQRRAQQSADLQVYSRSRHYDRASMQQKSLAYSSKVPARQSA